MRALRADFVPHVLVKRKFESASLPRRVEQRLLHGALRLLLDEHDEGARDVRLLQLDSPAVLELTYEEFAPA